MFILYVSTTSHTAQDAWFRISRQIQAAETMDEKIVVCCNHGQKRAGRRSGWGEGSAMAAAAWLVERYRYYNAPRVSRYHNAPRVDGAMAAAAWLVERY